MFARHACPCCTFPTLHTKSGFELCAVCLWEDDGETGGSLEAAQKHFKAEGTSGNIAASEPGMALPSRMAIVSYAMSVTNGSERFDKTLFESLMLAHEIAMDET